MRFDECWISTEQLELTTQLAAGTNDLPGEAIEVGVYQGRSAIPIANAVYPSTLHAVDNWQGGRDNPEAVAAGITQTDRELDRDNHGIFLANVAEGTKGNVEVWKMDWRDFAERWTKPVRFLHIDATHTAREVSDNIEAFLPYAVKGAVFCGDDYTFGRVREGVEKCFPNVNSGPSALWWVKI
jgi:hypothetical protein